MPLRPLSDTSAADWFVDSDADLQSLGLEHESAGAVPHFIWPADHAWFLAVDIDPKWIGVGGTRALSDELLADARLDVAPTTYDATDREDR